MLEDGVDAGKVLFLIANVMSSIPDRSFFSQTAKISKIELPHKLIDCMSRNFACDPEGLTCKVPCLYRVTINSTNNLRVKFSFSNFAV